MSLKQVFLSHTVCCDWCAVFNYHCSAESLLGHRCLTFVIHIPELMYDPADCASC